jgi:hypothetical protein
MEDPCTPTSHTDTEPGQSPRIINPTKGRVLSHITGDDDDLRCVDRIQIIQPISPSNLTAYVIRRIARAVFVTDFRVLKPL